MSIKSLKRHCYCDPSCSTNSYGCVSWVFFLVVHLALNSIKSTSMYAVTVCRPVVARAAFLVLCYPV